MPSCLCVDRAPAVFLDKDGTLIEDVPYNVDPALIRLAPGAGEALRRLRAAGYKLIVVSNQSGVARGLFAESALRPVAAAAGDLLAGCGGALAGFYYCPHHPEGALPRYAIECDCRKPAPGMLAAGRAGAWHRSAASWLIGDILNDVEAGHRAGCRTILLDNGNETEWELSAERLPDCVVVGPAARPRIGSCEQRPRA